MFWAADAGERDTNSRPHVPRSQEWNDRSEMRPVIPAIPPIELTRAIVRVVVRHR